MSTIKVIAPLSPAGDFPIADANNISLSSGGSPTEPGSVAEAMANTAIAVSELQQELGITAGPGESVSSKLESINTTLNSESGNIKSKIKDAIDTLDYLKGLLGNTSEDSISIDSQLGKLARDLEQLIEYIGTSSAEGLSSILNTISVDTDSIKNCLGDTDSGIQGQINSCISSISTLGASFANLNSTLNSNYTTLSGNLNSNYTTLSGKITETLSGYANTIAEGLNNVNANVDNAENAILNSIDQNNGKLETLRTNLNTDFENLLEAELGDVGQEDTVKGLIHTQTTEIEELQTTLGSLTTAIGTYTGGENVKTTIEGESNSIKETLSDLRSYMNTMIPPTLEVSRTGAAVYEYTARPTINIKAKVNRPLEYPLDIRLQYKVGDYVNSMEPMSQIPSGLPSGSLQYEVSCNFGDEKFIYDLGSLMLNDLPHTVEQTVVIVDDREAYSGSIYASVPVKCVFAAKVYYKALDKDSIEDDDILTFNGQLSAGHPSSVTFNGTDCYCYYLCPHSYGKPTISVGGFVGGFEKQEDSSMIIGDIYYDVYRSTKRLNDTTINIK